MFVSARTVIAVLACVLLAGLQGQAARPDRDRTRAEKRRSMAEQRQRDRSPPTWQSGEHSGNISQSSHTQAISATNSSNPSLDLPFQHPKPDDVQVGCKELRSKRYISDGFCTSLKPVTEVICTGHCLPIRDLPWYAEFIKVWSRNKIMEYRCVNDEVKRRRVHLSCDNGETRTYKIKVVKSCKCKKYMRLQNKSRKSWATDEQDGDMQKRRRRKNKHNKSDPIRPADTEL